VKNILFIWPGPYYNLQEYKYNKLSEFFSGYILTFSNKDDIVQTKKVAGFNLLCQRTSLKNKYYLIFKFFIHCVSFAIKKRLNKNGKFDLVVTYDPLTTGLIGVVVSRILSTKFAPEINGTYSSYYNFMDESRSKANLYAKVYILIMKFVFSFSNGIKYQYPGQIAFFEKKMKNRISTSFPNLVNLDKFTNNGEEKEILVVGFPFWRKGIDIAIQAFKLIAHKIPDWKLKILGWYPDTTLLNKYIGDCKQIYHHKPVFYQEMPFQLGKCGIVCCSSRSEGVPRILIESMMAEKPRIGTNIDGIPVLIKDGYDGFLFENENFKQLSEKILTLALDTSLRKKFGLAAKERVINEFSSEQYFSKLVSFYNKIIKHP
jgi:glycosyltransferase involved in cell wall biosynthesis